MCRIGTIPGTTLVIEGIMCLVVTGVVTVVAPCGKCWDGVRQCRGPPCGCSPIIAAELRLTLTMGPAVVSHQKVGS